MEKAFDYGVPTALVFLLMFGMYKLLTIIRADHRKDYEGVTKRLNEVEDFQKGKMTEVIDKNTQALTKTCDAVREVKEVVQKCKGPNHA